MEKRQAYRAADIEFGEERVEERVRSVTSKMSAWSGELHELAIARQLGIDSATSFRSLAGGSRTGFWGIPR